MAMRLSNDAKAIWRRRLLDLFKPPLCTAIDCGILYCGLADAVGDDEDDNDDEDACYVVFGKPIEFCRRAVARSSPTNTILLSKDAADSLSKLERFVVSPAETLSMDGVSKHTNNTTSLC